MKRILALVLACIMVIPALVGCGESKVIAEAPDSGKIISSNETVKLNEDKVQEITVTPIEKAYTRDGNDWKNMNWREIIAKRGLNQNNAEPLIFKTSGTGYTRYVYFTFDISSFKTIMYNNVFFKPAFATVGANIHMTYDIFKVPADSWSTDTITWANQPEKGEMIASNCVMGGMTAINLVDAVDEAIKNGEDKLSFVLISHRQTGGDAENSIDWKGTTLTATTSKEAGTYVKQLVSDPVENQAIWDYAQKIYDEWNVRYQYLLEEGTPEVDLIPVDPKEYTKTVLTTGSGITGYNKTTLETTKWKESDFDRKEATRTVSSLIGLGEYSDFDAVQEFDKYGGLIDEQLRQEATGFFYTTKIGDRWWVIDPLGYPCYIRAVSGVTMNAMSSTNQKNAALEKYGTAEKWTIAATRQFRDDWYFNAGTGLNSDLRNVIDGIIYQGSIGFVGSYGSSIGTNNSTGGSTTFAGNNTMNVFDPEFEAWCDEKAKAVEEQKDDEWLFGRTMDNELPMDGNMLYNYLRLPASDPIYHHSYAAAWTWLINITCKDNPTEQDVDDELLQLFVGFVYDRFYSLATTAIRKYDPNHMILGSRMLHGVISKPWVLRFASLHLDCLTINWYGEWDIPVEDLKLVSENANMPLMVTEFYTKAMDSGLDNTRGAGWVVKTQQDRGDFYQCYTLRLLECKNFVGWHWFQYIDNDPDPNVIYKYPNGVKTWRDQSNIDANKGIVSNSHDPYEDLVNSMVEINKNVYKLIDHFDAKYAN